MNEGSFSNSIIESIKLFKEYDLLYKENSYNINILSSSKYKQFISECRKLSYPEYYRYALENDNYDILLKDNSFLQFTFDYNSIKKSGIIRLAYYPSICRISYEEFLKMNELTYDECREEFVDDYQQYLIEQIPENTTPLRYDFDPYLYTERTHSSSHVHFGDSEDIRIPLNSIIKPVLFSKLVIEYYFYKAWKSNIEIKEYEKALYNSSEYEKLKLDIFSSNDQTIPYIFLS